MKKAFLAFIMTTIFLFNQAINLSRNFSFVDIIQEGSGYSLDSSFELTNLNNHEAVYYPKFSEDLVFVKTRHVYNNLIVYPNFITASDTRYSFNIYNSDYELENFLQHVVELDNILFNEIGSYTIISNTNSVNQKIEDNGEEFYIVSTAASIIYATEAEVETSIVLMSITLDSNYQLVENQSFVVKSQNITEDINLFDANNVIELVLTNGKYYIQIINDSEETFLLNEFDFNAIENFEFGAVDYLDVSLNLVASNLAPNPTEIINETDHQVLYYFYTSQALYGLVNVENVAKLVSLSLTNPPIFIGDININTNNEAIEVINVFKNVVIFKYMTARFIAKLNYVENNIQIKIISYLDEELNSSGYYSLAGSEFIFSQIQVYNSDEESVQYADLFFINQMSRYRFDFESEVSPYAPTSTSFNNNKFDYYLETFFASDGLRVDVSVYKSLNVPSIYVYIKDDFSGDEIGIAFSGTEIETFFIEELHFFSRIEDGETKHVLWMLIKDQFEYHVYEYMLDNFDPSSLLPIIDNISTFELSDLATLLIGSETADNISYSDLNGLDNATLASKLNISGFKFFNNKLYLLETSGISGVYSSAFGYGVVNIFQIDPQDLNNNEVHVFPIELISEFSPIDEETYPAFIGDNFNLYFKNEDLIASVSLNYLFLPPKANNLYYFNLDTSSMITDVITDYLLIDTDDYKVKLVFGLDDNLNYVPKLSVSVDEIETILDLPFGFIENFGYKDLRNIISSFDEYYPLALTVYNHTYDESIVNSVKDNNIPLISYKVDDEYNLYIRDSVGNYYVLFNKSLISAELTQISLTSINNTLLGDTTTDSVAIVNIIRFFKQISATSLQFWANSSLITSLSSPIDDQISFSLNYGFNQFFVEFSKLDGQSYSQDILIQRTSSSSQSSQRPKFIIILPGLIPGFSSSSVSSSLISSEIVTSETSSSVSSSISSMSSLPETSSSISSATSSINSIINIDSSSSMGQEEIENQENSFILWYILGFSFLISLGLVAFSTYFKKPRMIKPKSSLKKTSVNKSNKNR